MNPDPVHLPDLRRAVVSAVICGAAAATLWWVPASSPPIDPRRLVVWWDTAGTPDATIALVRVAGLALAAVGVGLGLLAVLVATGRVARLAGMWMRWAPSPVRRALAASTVAVSVATAAPVAGAETDDPPLLVDLGAAHDDDTIPLPRLVDLGPAATPSPVSMSPAASPPTVSSPTEGVTAPTTADADRVDPDDRWVVALGDHLWSIAEATLRDRGGDPDEAAIARYWRRLIEVNRDAIGGDPDIVHPGLELRLPR